MAKLGEPGGSARRKDFNDGAPVAIAPPYDGMDVVGELVSRVVSEVSIPTPALREGALFSDDIGRIPYDETLDSTRACLLTIEGVRAGRTSFGHLRGRAADTNRINLAGRSACKIYCPVFSMLGYCPVATGVVFRTDSKMRPLSGPEDILPLRDEDLADLIDAKAEEPSPLADRLYEGFTEIAISANPSKPSSTTRGQLLMFDAEEHMTKFVKSQQARFGQVPEVSALTEQQELSL